jgi:hypothetical protein
VINTGAGHQRQAGSDDLVSLEELIRFLAFVTESRHAGLASFIGRGCMIYRSGCQSRAAPCGQITRTGMPCSRA